MDRVILHSDCNSFYASVELLQHPEWQGRPLAVGGDPEARHGIVLAKEELAKRAGVKTGMALWQARQLCPEILFVPPHMDQYIRFSKMTQEIYAEYTDLWEPFGLDEVWLDVTASEGIKGSGLQIAEEIRSRIKKELGITVSIGISWNKIFAKFGSDYKKPDAITEITRSNYQDIVWSRPVSDLLYVGNATERKLRGAGIRTIGELAQMDSRYLHLLLGKMGYVLHAFANGEDETPVSPEHASAPVKSIGNSTTTPRDLVCDEDAAIIFYLLSELVGERLRRHGFCGYVISISVRDTALHSITIQERQQVPTDQNQKIAETALRLFRREYRWDRPVRSLGVRVSELVGNTAPYQTSLFASEDLRDKQHRMDLAVDEIRRRFGHQAIGRGLYLKDQQLSNGLMKERSVHPHSFMENGNQVGIEKYEQLLK